MLTYNIEKAHLSCKICFVFKSFLKHLLQNFEIVFSIVIG